MAWYKSILIGVGLLFVSGCAQHISPRVQKGALIGAGSGAAASAVTGGSILSGAAVGAIVGGGLAHIR